MSKYITSLTNLSIQERDKLALVWRKLSEEQKILLEEINIQMINLLRSKMDKEYKSEFYYSCRILSIQKYLNIINGFTKKHSMTNEELEKIQDLRIQAIRSTKKKDRSTQLHDIIRIRFYEIKQLRDKKMSWRDISNYLWSYSKTKIHYSYLRTIFKEVEVELNEK